MKGMAKIGVVDVVVAAFECAGTIERAVLSALTEPQVRRVFVIDDASRDETATRATALAERDPRVVVRRLSINSGPSVARNIGFSLGAAPWVAPLDGDDYFRPGRIARLLQAAEECDFVADDIIQIDDVGADGVASPRTLMGLRSRRRLDFAAFVAGNVNSRARRNELGFLKPLMRRSFLDRHGLHYANELRLGEDYALYAQALALGARFLVLPADTSQWYEKTHSADCTVEATSSACATSMGGWRRRSTSARRSVAPCAATLRASTRGSAGWR
jgi:succinoglycan biosynthesis protein ExoU